MKPSRGCARLNVLTPKIRLISGWHVPCIGTCSVAEREYTTFCRSNKKNQTRVKREATMKIKKSLLMAGLAAAICMAATSLMAQGDGGGGAGGGGGRRNGGGGGGG